MSRNRSPVALGWMLTTVALAAMVVGVAIGGFAFAADESGKPAYEPSGNGERWLESGKVRIKVLVEASNLGGSEFEVGQLELPVSYGKGLPHIHKSTEVFYVLSGKLGHTVHGKLHVLEPGMVGIVRPGDVVTHSVESDEPVKAIVIWAPGGEAERLTGLGFKSTPIDE